MTDESTCLPSILEQSRNCAAGFEFAPITIDPGRILRIHGYRDASKVRRRVRDIAVAMSRAMNELFAPAVALRRLTFWRAGVGTLKFENDVLLRCLAFEKYLRDCDEAVLFVLSAGAAIDENIARYMKDSQPVNALFLNTAGWLCVEMMTRQLASAVKLAAQEESIRLTRRMGPGYSYRVDGVSCSWELEQQRELFALIGEPQLAVTLLDSGGMQPQMSRSGLFGLRRRALGSWSK